MQMGDWRVTWPSLGCSRRPQAAFSWMDFVSSDPDCKFFSHTPLLYRRPLPLMQSHTLNRPGMRVRVPPPGRLSTTMFFVSATNGNDPFRPSARYWRDMATCSSQNYDNHC